MVVSAKAGTRMYRNENRTRTPVQFFARARAILLRVSSLSGGAIAKRGRCRTREAREAVGAAIVTYTVAPL